MDDTSLYSGMRNFMVQLPPQIPIPSEEESEGISPRQAVSPPQRTAWTEEERNVATDHLVREGGAVFNRPVPTQTPWMSTTQQQPFLWSGGSGLSKDDEVMSESTPRASAQVQGPYPHPDLSLPHPSLNLDFRMSVALNPKISVGPTPFGHRNWISFTGGIWSGSWGSGIVLPGGQDNQLVIGNGAAHLETSYILQTYDDPPAHIVIKTKGWRTGPPEILAQLADPERADRVDPNSYKFRLFIEMETGDERYRDLLNCGMWVGSGMRRGAEVIYDAYRLS